MVEAGHDVVGVVRSQSAGLDRPGEWDGAAIRTASVLGTQSGAAEALRGEPFDVVVSCLASRTGLPDDAWLVDYQANLEVLEVAKEAGIPHFILLSAICVQKPRLAFQHAKQAFEKLLIESGLTYSIVRPTAFFKSLSGQIGRVQQGKPFLVFGDGTLTSCKPISDRDLGRYLAECITDPARHNAILPIGGPGPAITPLDQAEALFGILGEEPRIRRVPVALLDAIIAALGLLGKVSRKAADKAELARIGRYYATESMLVLDPEPGAYSADATPSTGSDTLPGHYADIITGGGSVDLGEHAVFERG